MTYPFNPATDTTEHDEFIGTTGTTVYATASDNLEFQILTVDGQPGTVSCTRPYPEMGSEYEDMVITTAATSFTYACKFEYTFVRTTKYLYQPKQTQIDKHYFQVLSPHLLPPNDYNNATLNVFNGIYQVIPPQVEQVPVVFTVNGRERTITTIETEFGPSITYGPWYAKTYTWSVMINHNFQWTMYAIKKAVIDGTGYKKAIVSYPEAILDSITPPPGTPA